LRIPHTIEEGDSEESLDCALISSLDYFKGEDAAVASASSDDLRSYLRWHVIDRYAPLLTTAMEHEAFSFSGTVLSGAKEQRPQ
jgi:putative endopeptidase